MSMPRITMRSPSKKTTPKPKRPPEIIHNEKFDLPPASQSQFSDLLDLSPVEKSSIPYPQRVEVWKLYKIILDENHRQICCKNLILARNGGIYEKETKVKPAGAVSRNLEGWTFLKGCEGTPDQQRYALMGKGWRVPRRYPLHLSNYFSLTSKGYQEFRFPLASSKPQDFMRTSDEHPAYTSWKKQKAQQEKIEKKAQEQQVELSKAEQKEWIRQEQEEQKAKDEAWQKHIRDLADNF